MGLRFCNACPKFGVVYLNASNCTPEPALHEPLDNSSQNSFPWFSTLVILVLYLTIIPRVRVGNEMVDSQRGP